MTERKIWKVQEDQILKKLYQDSGITKWSEISRMMERVYGVQGRNGKQCRERYHNHLKNGINKEKWSDQEENRLVQLHSRYGNRWAIISKLIPGRTQNCVKNMLYSKLRKSVRQLNRFISEHYRRQLKDIKISFIYRLIQFTEAFYKREAVDRNQQENVALRIKNQILRLNCDNNLEFTEEEKEKIKTLISDIHVFKKGIRRCRGSYRNKLNKTKFSEKIAEQFVEAESEDKYIKEEDEQQNQVYFGQMKEEQHPRRQKLSITNHTLGEIQSKQREMTRYGRQKYNQMIGHTQPPIGSKFQSKLNIMHMDSLQSNISLLFEDKQLQDPIQMENPINNLTPLYPTAKQDWTSVISNWKPYQL